MPSIRGEGADEGAALRVEALDVDAIRWSRAPDGGPLLVMLHGYGGVADDWEAFFPLVPEGVVAASLQAPVPVEGRWSWVDYAAHGVAGVSAAARGILAWLDTVPASGVALLGFSQGMATSIHVLRQAPTRIAAVAGFGGFVWEARPHQAVARVRVPVLAGWGDGEDVIPGVWQAEARRWLTEHCDATLRTYPGVGHALTHQMVLDAIGFVVPRVSSE